MRRMALFIGLAVVTLPLLAQTPSTASATDGTAPALITDLTVSPHDSRLVRAAKLAVASRRALSSNGPVWHVDDSMVGHHLAAASGTGAPNGSSRKTGPAPGGISTTTISSGIAGATPAQLMQKKQALQQEQGRMSEEYDQPYAGDVPEGLSEKRLTEIPGQLKAIDQKLQPMIVPTKPPQ